MVGALRHERVTARCEVLADPGGDTLKFSWTYSKAKDVLPIPSDNSLSVTLLFPLQTHQCAGQARRAWWWELYVTSVSQHVVRY